MENIKRIKRSLLYSLDFTWQNSKMYISILALKSIIEAISPLINIYAVKLIIDELTNNRDIEKLILYVAVIVISTLVTSCMSSYSTYKIWTLQCELQRILIKAVMEKTIAIDFENLENPKILDLKKKAEKSYLGNASDEFFGIIKYFFDILKQVFSILGIVILLIQWSILAVIIITIFVTINSIFELRTMNKNYELQEECIDKERKWQYFRDLPIDTKAGKEIRTYNIGGWLVNKFLDISKITTSYYNKQFFNIHKSEMMATISFFLKDTLCYGYLLYSVVMKGMSIGNFSLYLNLIASYSNALKDIFENITKSNFVGLYIVNLIEYFNLPENISKSGTEIIKKEQKFEIEFDNVSYKYPGKDFWALENICLKIGNGEKLSIVGENGAGKTTFIKLLCRLYVPTEGRILINGIDINTIDLESYNDLIGTVFQDFQLFSISMKENLSLKGKYEVDKAKKAISEVSLAYLFEKYVDAMERDYTKLFSVDGIDFSGGESQKFAIARALYKNSPIIILDEPTAALDPKAEYEIYQSFNRLVSGKTAIYISHRLSSSKFCDNVAVFSKGKIIEYGAHKELIKNKKYYYELFNLQAQFYVDGDVWSD